MRQQITGLVVFREPVAIVWPGVLLYEVLKFLHA
jgi:hypothetical protein